MYYKLSKKWQFVVDIVMIVIGTFIMGFAFSTFLQPNNVSTGGFSGLSMIIVVLLEKAGITFLSTSAVYLILNLVLFVFSIKTVGKKFAIKAIIGILSFSLSMELFEILALNLKYEILISTVYGGFITGLGVGMVVRFGGSTGGSDMLASIVRKKAPQFTIGKVAVGVDMLVVVLSLLTFSNGIEVLPYTIVALMLCSFCMDFINEGYRQVRAYNIITDKPKEISELLMKKLHRGCTATKVVGMHTGNEKCVLICLITKFQANYLKRIVKEVDEGAFIYATGITEVVGLWAKDSELPTQEPTESEKKKSTKVVKKETEEK